MFVGSCNGMVRALDFKTGVTRWEVKVSPDSTHYFFHGDPLVTSNVVVIGADRAAGANIHAFDRATGKELWRYAVGRGVMGPIAGNDDRASASTVEGQLLTFEPRSGVLRWSRDLKLPGWEGPAWAGGRVFAATTDGVVHALNAESGRDEWTARLPASVSTTVAAAADDLYVGTSDGSVHRLKARDGALVASQRVDAALVPVGAPARTGDLLVFVLQDKSGDYRALVAVDSSLEHVRWRVSAAAAWSTSRVFAWGEVVLVGTSAGEIRAYCGKTGQPAWSRVVKGRVRAIGGAEDTLVAGTPAGDLHALLAPRSCKGD